MDRRHLIGMGAAIAAGGAGLSFALRSRRDPFAGYVGMAAPNSPVQTPLNQPQLVLHPAADLILFATFDLDALVLSTRSYRDDLSPISPLDLALGWGPSSDPRRIASVEYWQHDRWYVYRAPHPIGDDLRHSSANMHLIPETPSVEEPLRRARIGNLIRMRGHLCDIRWADGREMRSSRSRTDRDGGACEIVFVNDIRILA